MADRGSATRAGRPRSSDTTSAILDATLELWMERGYSAVSIDAIAARAGVSKPTIYRRWSGRQAILVAAIERLVPPGEVPDLGSFRDEVVAFLRDRAAMYRTKGVRRIMAGSVAASAEDDDFQRDVQPFLDRFPAGMRIIIQRGIARGDVRPDVDIELLTAMINGSFYYRSIIEHKGLDDRAAEFVADIVTSAVAP
ncbi:TetR/AcrR family transcriptional regulator [Rhodococcus jostii]|uniref:DNA-binding transcriptional regulator, AcrR family n=1 Tax=Rhodococcus jostii TaxID=132919 RepID=A0A1H4Z9H6_RHOJO|nr:TetR/AcrR family transcriptional regulator [Rhodococcus jostii]SED26852.1 DNA-binding transcriptional regulator, AcrR family [Rhodococcus jostii]